MAVAALVTGYVQNSSNGLFPALCCSPDIRQPSDRIRERFRLRTVWHFLLLSKDTEEPQFIKDNWKPAFIEGSYVSESLLSLIAYQKYGLYLPLYRQEKLRPFSL